MYRKIYQIYGYQRQQSEEKNKWIKTGQITSSRQTGSGQTRDGKSECRHSRNQRTKMNWNG